MVTTNRVLGHIAHLIRSHAGLNRAQWRLTQRQWHRQLSQLSHRPTPSSPSLRIQRRHASENAADTAKKTADDAAIDASKTAGKAEGKYEQAAQNAKKTADEASTEAAKTAGKAEARYEQAAKSSRSAGTRFKNAIYGTGLVLFLSFGFLYITDTRASIHQWLVVPTLRLLHRDPEEAHHAGVRYIQGLYNFNLHPRERGREDEKLGDLRVEVFGHMLDNPVGTSAGIDKDAEIPSPLFALGPAIVEVGGTTPLPQEGNLKPRVFRLPSQNALINRYGLNSQGADHVALQLRQRVREFAYEYGLGLSPEAECRVLDGEASVPPGSLHPGKLLAVQVAKNKATPDNDITAIARDYSYCVDRLAKYADILVVNVSSPNTPGLRDLQATAPLTAILSAVVNSAQSCDRKSKPAVMVKVSPDEDSDGQVEGICSAVWASGVDGVIVGNTTKKRPDPVPKGYIMPAEEEKLLTEMGGYSGPQMFERTLSLVKKYRSKLDNGPPEGVSQQEVPKPEPKPKADKAPMSPAEASTARDAQHLKPLTPEADAESKQSLIKIPEHPLDSSAAHFQASEAASDAAPPSESQIGSPPAKPQAATDSNPSKVIFATGGITNGQQCLQILNAGASVCQVYTAMMYGGVGTVTRIKREMREEIAKGKGGR